LKDAAGFDNLEGLGTIAMDLQGVGASQRAIVSTLGGNADLEFTNGAIRGVNIAQMIRNLGSGIVNGWQGGTAEKTDFASLGAKFDVAKGQAITKDLHLVGPLVRMKGSGMVDLPQKTLDFKVDPQLVASLEGQGGDQDIAGLGVPVIIKGPWAKPQFYPDIKGILQNPAQAYQRYKQFTKDVKKIPGAEALSNVIKDGKVDEDALIQGIGGLLGGSQAAPVPEIDTNGAPPADTAPVPEVDTNGAPPAEAAPPTDAQPEKTKKSAKKKKNQTQNQKFDAEDAAKELLNNWLTGQ
jgi:AsmA protein